MRKEKDWKKHAFRLAAALKVAGNHCEDLDHALPSDRHGAEDCPVEKRIEFALSEFNKAIK